MMKRREFIRTAGAASVAGMGATVGARVLAEGGEAVLVPKGKAEHCIMIWLGGGAAQIDTFDPKRLGDPVKKVAGSAYKAIDTAV